MLSDPQFGRLEQDLRSGGFTVDPVTGARPTTGWSVSLSGATHEVPIHQAGGAVIREYARRHQEALSQPGLYVGGWRRTSGGEDAPKSALDTGVLDNTRVEPRARRAKEEMVMENQEAIYHNKTGKVFSNVLKGPTGHAPEWPQGFDREAYARDVADLYRKARGRPPLAVEEGRRSIR